MIEPKFQDTQPKKKGSRVLFSRPAILFGADCISFAMSVICAVLTAMIVRHYTIGYFNPPVISDKNRILIVFGIAFIILTFRSSTLGHYTQFRPFWLELKELIKTVGLIAAFDAFILFAIGVQFSRLWFGFFLIYLVVLVPYGRERSKIWMIRHKIWYQPTLIVGVGSNARKTAIALKSDTSLGRNVVGFVSLETIKSDLQPIDEIPVFHDLTEAKDSQIRKVDLIFAFETLSEMNVQRHLINQTIAENTQVTVVPPGLELPLYGASVVGIFRHDTALINLQNRLADPISQKIKRATDVVFGIVFLLVFSPIFLILTFVICRDGGSVFFSHVRMGKNGRHFKCHKFRTMVVDSEMIFNNYLKKNPHEQRSWVQKRKLENDPRVTRIGRYLRRTSLDELPQLVNVIKGEMSLVGPRPIVDDEYEKYGPHFSYYTMMKPGMTGLWQVSGRTETTYQERVRLDVWYCKNWTLWNDVVILIKTCKTLLNRHGAY